MENMKALSILIPVYNQQNLVLRALDSIPVREDIEVIVIDDGSTDNTWENLLKYRDNSDLDIVLLYNEVNKGVASAINKGLDNFTGRYVMFLGSDDYLYPERLVELLEANYTEDMIYFDLEINDGQVFPLNPLTKKGYCGSTKLISKNFLGDMREDEKLLAGEDLDFNNRLLEKNPTERFTHIILKHYNFPREGSLSWKQRNGLL